jgi:hypothetical protein
MRALIVFVLCVLYAPAYAAAAKTAVFDLELLDMSQEGASNGPRADETQRLALASAELRRLLAASDQIATLDTAPEAKAIHDRAPLFKCNGCVLELARSLGADLAVSGFVEKTSNLIVSFAVTMIDVKSGKQIRSAQVDIRGNNDEMWLRGVRWMVKNRLLAEPLPGTP